MTKVFDLRDDDGPYTTVDGILPALDFRIDKTLNDFLEKRATELSKEMGHPIHHLYHVDVLMKVYKEASVKFPDHYEESGMFPIK